MDSKTRMPKLSLVVPDTANNPPQAVVGPSGKSQRPAQTASQSNGLAPAKQKRLFPVACRLVSMDQWFTTRIDRTWNILDLKIWLLSKALPTPVLPLPASYRPSSPVTFATSPPPVLRPPAAPPYHTLTPPAARESSTTLISPITFAAAPESQPSTTISPSTPGRQVFYPPLSTAMDSPSSSISSPAIPSPSPTVRLSQDDEPLYANPYGPMLNSHFEDDDDDDKVVQVAPRSIPYSYNTGAPAISGLAALKSNSNKIISGRGYSSSLSSVDMDLVRQAMAIAKQWHVYSFSTGMLLSDDLPVTEYSIHPYELLELHRAGGYVSLPRTILPGLDPYSSGDNRDPSHSHPTSTKTTFAYPSITTRPFNHHPSTPTRQSFSHQGDVRDAISSPESSDDEYDDIVAGSPYAQPYFDGWVWVLQDGASGPNGNCEPGTNDVCDGDGLPGRKMRRRGRAKSDTAKSGRGKDRARMEREWKDMTQPLRKEGDAEVRLQESGHRWNKRWLTIREGIMTLWKERQDHLPEERYKIAACAALYGADRFQPVLTSTSQSHTPFTTPIANANPLHASTFTSKMPSNLLSASHHIICARFRQRSSPRGNQATRMDGKASRKSLPFTRSRVVLKVADATIHEHLLRIFHRLSYSSQVDFSNHPSSSSAAPSRTLHTRTLRTDFVPNPIPHPLSLSFSAPSPIQQDDDSPLSPSDDLRLSDGSDYDDEWLNGGSAWGRSQRKAVGKSVAGYVGLGLVVGVRYPEWREEIIQKAIHAGRGVTIPESQEGPDLSPQTVTPLNDEVDMYGLRDDLDSYAANLAYEDHSSDDSDSDAFSEAEWEGWAYDLDRPKVVDEIGTISHNRKPSRDGLTTPHGSPVSDPEPAVTLGYALDGASFPSTNTLRLRAQSVGNHNHSPIHVEAFTPSPSPTSASPTTPSTRVRASTISAHPHISSNTVVETISIEVPHLGASASSQIDNGLRPNIMAALRTEPNTSGGVRSIMRGLSMRAGKESFLRGLENALDFVEGK